MIKQPIVYNEYTTEELLKMRKSEAIEGLNEQQQRFCEFYVYSHNIRSALIKAGYTVDNSSAIGMMLRRKPPVKRYIQWLKARTLDRALVKGSEIIEQWAKIAFADITDIVDIRPNFVSLKPSNMIDGQLVKSVRSDRNGISVELHDKLKALDSLAKYTEDMPKDYRRIIDERRQNLLEEEFELKKKLSELSSVEDEDDGFLEALAKSSKEVWENQE